MDTFDQKKILDLLKKNAPYVYLKFVNHIKFKLNNNLSKLRTEYKEEASPEKKIYIKNKAEEIKGQLALY